MLSEREAGEKTADFKVGDWIIEVGGEKKRKYQRPDYIVVDGLLTGNGRIPLFLFGLIYYLIPPSSAPGTCRDFLFHSS